MGAMAAGWFFDRVMDRLFNIGFDYLQDQLFGGLTCIKEELGRLQQTQPLIQAVVSAYPQKNITDPNLKSWLWQLRDAIDEVNDVLDDFKYMKLQEQLGLNMEGTKVRSLFTSLFSKPARKIRKVGERPFKIDPKRLEEAVQKLDGVSAQAHTFFHLVEKIEREQQLYVDRESGSIPGPLFIGRNQEKEDVMRWLTKPSNHNLSLLSIVGHGGMGKTTLLQNIYDADEITKEFDLKIWVCVSHNFEVEKVITEMLKYLGDWRSHLTEISSLQEKLRFVTQSEKFLLVLDDIWEETTTTKWEKVFSPLANGKLGSKILVTTRTHAAASIIPGTIIEKKARILEGLEEARCLELFETYAFAGKDLKQYKKLMCIAKEIVKRLSGSPLAAKVIGGVLNSKLNDESAWTSFLNSTNVLNVELDRNSIFPILKLSFSFLSQPQQNCFTFCGIFPQDHQFDKDDLVRMWIALGFIQESSTSAKSLEDIGGSYFDTLLRNSFFDQFQDFGRIYYKMHDLLHHLAQSISSEECFRFVGDDVLSLIPKTIRHLFVKTENLEVLRMIKNVKSLHSLFLTSERHGQDFTEILTEIFEASASIRLLFIHSVYLKKMPEAIKNLRHLRYLNLTGNLTQMPRSLSSLYHLQFIIYIETFSRSCSDDFLPDDVSNLFNLRHLKLPLYVSIRGIGKLMSLQELNEFNVKNENGYRIGELKEMNELRKLNINGLENVNNAAEARNAKLCEKRKLTDLFLKWKSDMRGGSLQNFVNSDLDRNVLENLEPYENLKRLSIDSYEGARSAKWMNNVYLISNLEYIRLDKCSKWETLPPFGQLPFLKSLYLCNMPKAKQLAYKFPGNDKVSVFPSLEVLHMEGLQVLEDWFDGAGATACDCFFPCLTELFLVNCPNLQELPHLPPKIKKMVIRKIGWKAALNCKQETNNRCGISKSIPLERLEVLSCPNITSLLSLGGLQLVESGIERFQLILSEVVIDDPSLLPTVSIASLEKLAIWNNDVLVSFTIEVEQWFPHVSSSLRRLSFEGLKSLQSLPSSLERLSSLEFLQLQKLPQLQRLLHIPASLKVLRLEYLESLQCLPSLSAISSLNRLDLESIPLLKSLPELPPSLSHLYLKSLDNLQCQPSSLSAISSLKYLVLESIPLLKSLPELPPSLSALEIRSLDNLKCLPSSLSAISSLNHLHLENIPLLKSLPELPPSLKYLHISSLDNLQCLPPSLLAISSLEHLNLRSIPLLKSLSELPPSLKYLHIKSLDNLECLPSSLSVISSLYSLNLESIPLLKSLPDLPSSVNLLYVTNCHPELMKRYDKY